MSEMFLDESSADVLNSLTTLHLLGVVLAAVTGTIHLWLGITGGSIALLTAGVGLTIGIVAIVTDVRRKTFIKLGIPFTATQAVYYLATHFDQITVVSAIDKIVQCGLITVLFVLYRRE